MDDSRGFAEYAGGESNEAWDAFMSSELGHRIRESMAWAESEGTTIPIFIDYTGYELKIRHHADPETT